MLLDERRKQKSFKYVKKINDFYSMIHICIFTSTSIRISFHFNMQSKLALILNMEKIIYIFQEKKIFYCIYIYFKFEHLFKTKIE